MSVDPTFASLSNHLESPERNQQLEASVDELSKKALGLDGDFQKITYGFWEAEGLVNGPQKSEIFNFRKEWVGFHDVGSLLSPGFLSSLDPRDTRNFYVCLVLWLGER